MSASTACPGDPNGHVWQLERADRWIEEVDRGWSRRRIVWYVIGALIPIIGWIIVACDWSEGGYEYRGIERVWYCVKCRQFETTKEAQ